VSTAIKIKGLSKKYIIGHQNRGGSTTLRDVLSDGFSRAGQFLSGNNKPQSNAIEEFWALQDISLDVQAGERIGIIGRNGAGKSTLLKILSRITEPTRGSVSIQGRLASLLEVGTGFHPELTGRENIYLNGAILGMSKAEIKNRFDEIVAFSEVERFLDTPVKRYSSGMVVRLAFSVAAHLEPEILVVDEVLAVGDAQFQRKCLGKMGEAGKDGRTVLFVSHNMAALKSLCTKAVWLDAGRLRDEGPVAEIVSTYLQNGLATSTHKIWENENTAPGDSRAKLHSAKISYAGSDEGEIITVATPLDVEFECWNYEDDSELNFSMVLYDNQEVCVFNTTSPARRFPKGLVKGTCRIPGNFLNDNTYRVRILIVKDKSVALADIDSVATFVVHDGEREGAWYGKRVGVIRPVLEWNTGMAEPGHV